ncbi:PAS domain S-box protein [Virgibacillus xinjiangensis]|uniref:PAS domain S-box protein n=1 Tax=Virgibacillus xinjiangensis TaxID=393090 RepID=A0ABV7CQZ0_9BACI
MKESEADGSSNLHIEEEMYRQIVEYSYETTIIHSNHEILYINQSGADFIGLPKEEIIGSNIIEIFTQPYREYAIDRFRQCTEEDKVGDLVETTIHKADGSTVDVELFCHPVMFGKTKAIQSTIRDITPRKEAQKQLRQIKSEVATPIVPIHDEISVLPLVGNMDEDRLELLLDIIPRKIEGQELQYLIIDLSGAYSIDTNVIDFVYRINSISTLLGVTTVYTGIRPDLTKNAVDAYIDTSNILTMSNVKQALKKLAQ